MPRRRISDHQLLGLFALVGVQISDHESGGAVVAVPLSQKEHAIFRMNPLPERIGRQGEVKPLLDGDPPQRDLRVHQRGKELGGKSDREHGQPEGRGRSRSAAKALGAFGQPQRGEDGVERIDWYEKANRARKKFCGREGVQGHEGRKGGGREEGEAPAVPTKQPEQQDQAPAPPPCRPLMKKTRWSLVVGEPQEGSDPRRRISRPWPSGAPVGPS